MKPTKDQQVPPCCTDPMWDGKFSPCGIPLGKKPPKERPANFDSTWCEEISDLCTLHVHLCLHSTHLIDVMSFTSWFWLFYMSSLMTVGWYPLLVPSLLLVPRVVYADDVGLGLVCTAIIIGMAYVVHSFRVQAKDSVTD